MVNDKKSLLQYLQSETSKLETNTEKLTLETISNINTLKQAFESYKSTISDNEQVILCHSL